MCDSRDRVLVCMDLFDDLRHDIDGRSHCGRRIRRRERLVDCRVNRTFVDAGYSILYLDSADGNRVFACVPTQVDARPHLWDKPGSAIEAEINSVKLAPLTTRYLCDREPNRYATESRDQRPRKTRRF